MQHGIDFRTRKIYLDEYIDRKSCGLVIRALHLMEDESKDAPITLIINSEGGEIEAGLSLVDALLGSPCPITTIGTGEVASMAFVILLTGDTRQATKRTNFMTHQGWTTIEGNTTEAKRKLALMEKLETICYELINARTKKSRKWWEAQCENTDYWFNSKDALKLGVIHSIIDNEHK